MSRSGSTKAKTRSRLPCMRNKSEVSGGENVELSRRRPLSIFIMLAFGLSELNTSSLISRDVAYRAPVHLFDLSFGI